MISPKSPGWIQTQAKFFAAQSIEFFEKVFGNSVLDFLGSPFEPISPRISRIFTNFADPTSNLCALRALRGEFLNTLLRFLLQHLHCFHNSILTRLRFLRIFDPLHIFLAMCIR